MKESDEFRPFIRGLPEFKFWYAITKEFIVAFVMTFFSIFDVPVFWPKLLNLLCYWVIHFVLTMKCQIMHMIKYIYIPLNLGKKVCGIPLTNNVVDIIFNLFDTNRDRTLGCSDEFLKLLKQREKDLSLSYSADGIQGLLSCCLHYFSK